MRGSAWFEADDGCDRQLQMISTEWVAIASRHFQYPVEVLAVTSLSQTTMRPRNQKLKVPQSLYSQSVEELELDVKILKILKRSEIKTLEELADYTEQDLLEVNRLGKRTVTSIVDALIRFIEKKSEG